ncbi:uncharacterized protein G2W53_037210 [Senna tora]|uniref:Uncharacterized protein n=1 Tax=Senna tora TaxID=362788 RepID=A0A834SYT4_9FABA|nr:uncharacterized protein G2W53_037210 [Senna tora]
MEEKKGRQGLLEQGKDGWL